MTSHRIVRLAIIGSLLLLALVMVLYFAAPTLVERELQHWADEANYDQVQLEEVRIDPLQGRVYVRALKLVQAGETVLDVAEADLDIAVLKLLRGQLHIELARLIGARLRVHESDDGSVSIAGVTLDESSYPIDLLHLVDAELYITAPRFETSLSVNDLQFHDRKHVVADVIQLKDIDLKITHSDVEVWQLTGSGDTINGAIELGAGGEKPDTSSSLLGLSFDIATIEITGESVIHYEDLLLDTELHDTILIDEARITGLNSVKPDEPLVFMLREHSPKGVSSTWRGEAYPFKSSPELSLQVHINSADLPFISQITHKALGLSIDGGEATLDLDVDIQGDEITGSFGLNASSLEISAEGEQVLSVRDSSIKVSLAELLRKELKIESARLDGGRVAVELIDNDRIKIAGLLLAETEEGEGTTTLEMFPIEVLHITDSRLDLVGPGLQLELEVNDLTMTDGTTVAADNISLRNLQLAIIHENQNDWKLVGKSDHTEINFGFGSEGYDAAAHSDALPSLILRVNKIELIGASGIRYDDRYLALPFIEAFQVEEAFIRDLDSASPQSPSAFTLKLRSDRHELIHVKGNAKPFAPNPTLTLDGKLEAFPLTQLSKLTDTEYGFLINTGQLDTDIQVNVAAGQIEGILDMRLNLLSVSTTDRKKVRPFEKSLYEGLTLRQMIYLLRDKKGVMSIKVPITGDAHAPTFGLDLDMESAINKAVGSVIGLAIVPVIGALALLSKPPRVAKVDFAKGSDTPDERGDQQIQKAASKLAQSDHLVTVCGTAVSGDIETSSEDGPEGHERALLALADRRAQLVRNSLINNHGIEPKRLIACRSKKTNDRRPHVDVR